MTQPDDSFHRILIVDDDCAVAEATRLLLEILGHQVWTATGGQEALQKVPALRPSVIFLDLEMPGMDGFETLLRLRQMPFQDLMVVAYTGRYDELTRYRVQTAGFDHYLPKPTTVQALRALLAD